VKCDRSSVPAVCGDRGEVARPVVQRTRLGCRARV